MGEQGIISTIIYRALCDLETEIWANPDNIRDYIYIDDCTSAVFQLLANNAQGVFNISSGIGYSIKDIVSSIQLHFTKPLKLRYLPKTFLDESINVLNNQNIIKETGWSPVVNIEEGIKRTFDFLKNAEKPSL